MFPLYTPLKKTENLWFSDVFKGYRNGTLSENEIRVFFYQENFHKQPQI